MALSKKQRQKLKLADKRRARRPEPTISIAAPMTVKNSERNRLTNTNPGMLLSLESLLVEEAERNAEIDDAVLAAALRSVAQSKEPKTELIGTVVDALHRWQSVQDDNLQTGLAMRVIHESIRKHSDGKSGSYGYILYASTFVKNAATLRSVG